MEKHYLPVTVDANAIFIYYLAKKLKVNPDALQFLYEELGDSLFFVFYILSGTKIEIPTALQFQRLRDKSKASFLKYKGLSNHTAQKTSENDSIEELSKLEIELFNLIDADKNEILLEMSDVVYKES